MCQNIDHTQPMNFHYENLGLSHEVNAIMIFSEFTALNSLSYLNIYIEDLRVNYIINLYLSLSLIPYLPSNNKHKQMNIFLISL
jgi:hypothetical protein